VHRMVMRKPFLLLVVILFSLLLPLMAEEKLRDSRVWHGKNGKHFRGQFLGREGDTLRIMSTQGKIYKVPMTSLSEDDLVWFKKAWSADQQKKTHIKALVKPGAVTLMKEWRFSKVAPIGYESIPDEKVVRANLPVLTPSEFRAEANNKTGSSLVPFFLWWHNYKVLNVPSRRDDHEKRVEWLFKTLNKKDFRYSRLFDVTDLNEFCREDLEAKACFEVVDLRDAQGVKSKLNVQDRLSPQFLSHYTQGANATILSVRIYKGGNYEWTAEVPLVECTPDGRVTFYMYGDIKLTGRLEKLPFDEKVAKKLGDRSPRYEIKVNNMSEAHDWFQDREYTFFLEGGQGVGLVVIKPYKLMQPDEEAAEEDK